MVDFRLSWLSKEDEPSAEEKELLGESGRKLTWCYLYQLSKAINLNPTSLFSLLGSDFASWFVTQLVPAFLSNPSGVKEDLRKHRQSISNILKNLCTITHYQTLA